MHQPTLTQIMATLDELAAAARAGDLTRYLAALDQAQESGLTAEQVADCYAWGTRDGHTAPFDIEGKKKTNDTRHAR